MAIRLNAGEYFKLRTLIRDAEVIELDAIKAAQRFAQARVAADRATQAHLAALAEKYRFDASQTFGWNDDTCELVPQA